MKIFAKLSNEMNDDDEGHDELTSMPLTEFEPRVMWQQCLQAENTIRTISGIWLTSHLPNES